MIRNIALALTIAAAISTGAAAQSDPYHSWLNDLLKPYEAKTTPVDANAPPPQAAPHLTRATLPADSNSLLDGCVITAIGRLPKVDGLRVINTAYEFRNSDKIYKKFEYWNVGVLTDLNGRQATYQWVCRVYDNTSATLIDNR